MAVACYNCSSRSYEQVTQGVDHEYKNTTDDVFNVVKCSQCGLFYLNPRPDLSELSTIYPPDYYAYHLQKEAKKAENTSSLLYRARRHVYVNRLEEALGQCARATGNNDVLKVLDIGCADGRALNWYRQVPNFKVQTFGVDFDRVAVDQARQAGHEVFEGTFENAAMPESFFDMAVATHVIEHVADPQAFAKKAFDVLKPGGVFLVETPNIDCADAKWFKTRHWGGYHFPRHWVFFDERSLRKLGESVGFEVKQITYHPAPAFWNWTFHSLLSSLSPDSRDGFFARMADYWFPPQDFQKNSLRNLIFVCAFTAIDIAIRAATGKTSNMSFLFSKPASRQP